VCFSSAEAVHFVDVDIVDGGVGDGQGEPFLRTTVKLSLARTNEWISSHPALSPILDLEWTADYASIA